MKASHLFLVIIAALLLAACRGDTPSPPIATTNPSETREVPPSSTAAPLVAATLNEKDAPEATLSGGDCLQAGGQVDLLEIDSDFMTGGLRLRVYTPPCYIEQAQRQFAVLYLFHGQTYNDDQWVRLGVDETADALISGGELAPFLIVMPYYSSSNQPSANPFGQAVIEELLPWVQAHYRVLTDRDHQAVGGLSMGASWALHFGMTHPELFGAMAGHSPPVFVEDAAQVRGWLAEIPEELMPRIWLDIGDHDQAAILESAQWFEGALTEMAIPHEWHLFTGRHEEAYWSEHVEMYLRWYAAEW